MEVFIVKNATEGGQLAFELLEKAIASGAKILGLATGSTPISFYDAIKKSDLNFSDMISINLDEYVGLPETHPQSYAYFMQEQLFHEKPFKQSHLPNGLAEDLNEELKRYDAILEENPIDFQILGIGHNGHIGFNEPGTSFDTKTQIVDLTGSTIEANSRFFDSIDDVPRQAISMGIDSILSATTIVLMAYGEDKADAISKLVDGEQTIAVPATALQSHPNVIVICDQAAAKKLERTK